MKKRFGSGSEWVQINGGKRGYFWILNPKKSQEITINPKKSQKIPRNLKKSRNPKSKVVFSNILQSYFQALHT